MRAVHAYNEHKGEVVAAYTFDAGPNAVIYTTEDQVPELLVREETRLPPSLLPEFLPLSLCV